VPPVVPNLSPWGPVRRAVYGAALGLLIGGLLLWARGTHGLEALELRLVDVRTRAFVGQREPDPRIVLCLVHDVDHQRVTRSDLAPGEGWPWSLDLHELALRGLAAGKPRVVLIDLLHVDRGQGPDDVNVSEEDRAQPWFQALVREASQAQSLAEAYRAVGPVVLGFQLDQRPTDYEQPPRAALARPLLRPRGPFEPGPGLERDHATLPVSGLLPGASLLGFTNVEPDVDGVQRRAFAVGRWAGLPVASLPLAGAWLTSEAERSVAEDEVRLGASRQRLDAGGGFYVNFRGEPGKVYRQIPVGDLVQMGLWLDEGRATETWDEAGRKRLDELRDAVVVYGASLAGNDDTVASPLSGRQLGPEYQATILDNLLHGDGRVRVPRGVDAALLLGLTGLSGLLGTLLRGRWWPQVPTLVLLVAVLALAWGLFERGTVIDVVTPTLGLLITWGGAGVMRLLTEGRRNKWLESTFGRYVAPDVIDALKKNPDLLALGGRRRDLTILFSDVAGFTGMSERLAAEDNVRLLNRYLTTQAREMMATGGVIDKFMGDGVLAFWGDPISTPDHALRAVRAALRCQEVLPEIAPLVAELGLKGFEVRIGLSSGPAVVGNMGSDDRFSYTCMGDTVNLASRLEGANKAFGSRIMVAAPTYLMVREHVIARRLADVTVVGRREPVRVYEVLSLREDADPALRAHAEAFNLAHAALRGGDLATAQTCLAQALHHRPDDRPTLWLAALAARMAAGSAPIPWDGALSLTEK
jgi:adenylate cyclase